jgi:carboxymethylenebutenolidase
MTDSEADLGAVFDAHVKAEFVDLDVDAAMATMTADPYLTHIPAPTGGYGHAELTTFYRDHFVGSGRPTPPPRRCRAPSATTA